MTQKDVRANVKDLRAQGYYSDHLLLFETFSAIVDSVQNTMCYVRRCEDYSEPVLEIQGVELAQRFTKIFHAYKKVVAKRSPLLME